MKLAYYADVWIEPTITRVTGEGGVPFPLPFIVRSNGNLAAEDVVATITLPALSGFAIESAASSAGACEVSGMAATCALGVMDSNASHTITVNGRGTTAAATFSVQSRVNSGQ